MITAPKLGRILIVAVRNAGRKFELTRHNVGSYLAQSVAHNLDLKWQWSPLAAGSYCVIKHKPEHACAEETILYLPTGWVNTTGYNVERAVKYFEIDNQLESSLYVLHDCMEVKPGKLKLTEPGFSLKGHNGLRSIEKHLGSNCFNRIKIGIGRPKQKSQVGDWVMGDFTQQELSHIDQTALPALQETLQSGSLLRKISS